MHVSVIPRPSIYGFCVAFRTVKTVRLNLAFRLVNAIPRMVNPFCLGNFWPIIIVSFVLVVHYAHMKPFIGRSWPFAFQSVGNYVIEFFGFL